MAHYKLVSGHAIGLNRKVTDGIHMSMFGNFEQGHGVMPMAVAEKMLDELAGLLDRKVVPLEVAGTAGAVEAELEA